MTTDEEAEAFLDQDLLDLNFTQFKLLDWERHLKTARVNMRLPQRLLDALKAKAAKEGGPISGSSARPSSGRSDLVGRASARHARVAG